MLEDVTFTHFSEQKKKEEKIKKSEVRIYEQFKLTLRNVVHNFAKQRENVGSVSDACNNLRVIINVRRVSNRNRILNR